MLVQTNPDQEKLALRTLERGYVGMKVSLGENWSWYAVKTTMSEHEAENWFDQQLGRCRVYLVSKGQATIIFAK